jgi:hypothetical protein
MQDVQNIPNPDTSPNNEAEDFGSHSDLHPETQEGDIETPGKEGDVGEHIPTPNTNDFPSQEDPDAGNDESDLL